MEDVLGTLKQWKAWVYARVLERDNEILPVEQQYADENAIYLGGWTGAKPGKHSYVISTDFSSLYPSVTRGLECALKTFIKPEEQPDDLKELLKNYNFYKPETAMERSENDNVYELQFFIKLMKK